MAEHVSETDHPNFFRVPEGAWPRFAAKLRLYREASILMRLSALAKTHPEYEDLLVAFEDLIYSADNQQIVIKVEALKYAMMKLHELVSMESKAEFHWSMDWLQGLGYSETNPVILAQLALYWLSHAGMVSEALSEFCPH